MGMWVQHCWVYKSDYVSLGRCWHQGCSNIDLFGPLMLPASAHGTEIGDDDSEVDTPENDHCLVFKKSCWS